MTLSCRVLPRVLSGEPTRLTRYLQNHPRSTPRHSHSTILLLYAHLATRLVYRRRVLLREFSGEPTRPPQQIQNVLAAAVTGAALWKQRLFVAHGGCFYEVRGSHGELHQNGGFKIHHGAQPRLLGHRSTRLISCVAALRSGSA